MVLVFRDFSEQKKIQESLSKYARMLDAGFDAILLRDAQDRIIRWNRGAAELYGWTTEEAVGRITHDLFKTKFPKPLAEIDADLRRIGRWEIGRAHV